MALGVRVGSLGAVLALSAACWLAGCSSSGSGGSSAEGSPPRPAAPAAGVRLARNVHPLARPELDRGPLDPARRIENLAVVFKRSPQQEADLEALRAAQVDPASPSFHRWLTPEEYAARFGARPADIARTIDWLRRRGFDVHATSRLGTRVGFGGTVAQIQSAFRTEVHHYEVAGEMHYAMASAPAIPAELADVVLALHNTHDFYPRPAIRRAGSGARVPSYNGGKLGDGLLPADWASVYDVAPLYGPGVNGTAIDGTGVTIAVVGIAQIAPSDLAAFRTLAGLPASSVTATLVPNTGAATPGQQGAGSEAVLDVEWSGGIAKGATIDYVFTGGNDGNVDDATFYAIEENLAPIISESWGGCEAGLSASDADVTAVYGSAANVLGITYLAAAGDEGAAGCGGASQGGGGLYVELPAAYPGVTAVGGTEFPQGSLVYGSNGTVQGYGTQETVWNEGDDPSSQQGLAQGGGGISVVFGRPSYQSAIPTCSILGSLPASGVTPSSMREVPDVSFTAASGVNPYFVECTIDQSTQDCSGAGGSPQTFAIGGTSCGTPSFAGVVALLDQIAGGRLGNINPMLYGMSTTTPAAFHDITTGDNESLCMPGSDPGCPAGGKYGYAASTGYDCASGLGSMDVAAFATAVASLGPTTTALAVSPTTTTEGSNVSLTATVTVPTPNANVLGGLVTFAFQSYTASGAPDLSWTVGTAPIAGGTTAGGTATLPPTPIPPGLVNPSAQYVDLVAMYGGDASHLPSTSTKQRLDFTGLTLAVSPSTSTVAPGGMLHFTATGGVSPVKWYIDSDTTCAPSGNGCSYVDETSGAFTAAARGGAVVIAAIDAVGAEALANVTVTPATSDGGIDDAGPDGGASDAGAPEAGAADAEASDAEGSDGAIGEAGEPGPMEAGAATDSGADGGSAAAASSGGCGCTAAGRDGPSPAPMIGAMGFALGVVSRRRGRRRRPA